MSELSLNARVRAHLRGSGTPHVVHRAFPEWQAADVAIACKEYWEQRGAEVVGFSGDPMALCAVECETVTSVAPPVLQQIDVPGDGRHYGLREGLALLDVDGTPMIAACRWECVQHQRYDVTVIGDDLERAQQLLDALADFAEGLRPITSSLFARVAGSLNTRLRAHLGQDVVPSVLVHAFPEYQIANAAILAKEFFDGLGAEFTGVGERRGFKMSFGGDFDPVPLLQAATIDQFGHFEGYEQTAPAFEQFDIDGVSTRLGLREGVALLRFEDEPMFVHCERHDVGTAEYRVTVVTNDPMAAKRLLDAFLEYERRHSIFRGRLIRPDIDYASRVTNAEILPSAEVKWADAVLPDRLRRTIERDVVAYVRAADALALNGIAPKRSFLFHGPPGTGKTFMCKLLATELRGFTSVLVTGENLTRPGAAFALARTLAPALLLFEDVDLVAKDRNDTPYPTALGGLLNELDGVPASDRVYAVFTTNRLKVLEAALAQRPGRVDLIIGFPLPDAALRRRLIELYAGRARVRAADVEWIADRTDGVTPAFLREFMKEAVFAAIRGGAVDDRGIADVDRTHLAETAAHFEMLREEHDADRMLGFRA